MSKKNCGCGKNTDCKCHEKKGCYTTGCEEKISSECVIYKPNGGTSYLNCFLGINTKTPLQEILERLDNKLCSVFTFSISDCAKQYLGVGNQVEFSLLINKLLDKICTLQDVKVKVSSSDNTSGYLFDKVVLGDCLIKEIVSSSSGQQLRIRIDYACLATKLPTCIEVDCCGGQSGGFSISTNGTTVCGVNTKTITAVNCSSTITWYKNGVIQSSTSSTLVATAGSYYATCNGVTSNVIVITNTGNCGSTTYTSTRVQDFSKNDCASTCTPSVVSFTKTYTSTISQADADLQKTNDTTYVTQGQSYANLNGTCTNCNCLETTWTQTVPLQTRCQANVSQIQETSNCGSIRWVNGGTACTCVPTNVYTCITNVTDTEVTFFNSCGTEENTFTWGNSQTFCTLTTATVTLATVEKNNLTYSGYIIEYGIESINNIPQTIVYQSSNVFNNLLENTSYKFKTKISKNGTSCAYAGVINTPQCTIICNSQNPAITITSNKTTVCNPDNTVILSTVSTTDCDSIEWYRYPLIGNPNLLGTGTSITLNPTSNISVIAKCYNCNGNAESNIIDIINPGDCNATTYSATITVDDCQNFSKNDCASNCTTEPIQYCATSTQTRTSTVSQVEADNLAGAAASLAVSQDISNNGQNFANTNGVCNCPPSCITPTADITVNQQDDSNIQFAVSNIVNGTHVASCLGSTFNCGTGTGFDIATDTTATNSALKIVQVYSTQSVTYTFRIFNVTSDCYTDFTVTGTNTTPYSNCPTPTFIDTIGTCSNNLRSYSVTIQGGFPPYQWSTDNGVSYTGCLLGNTCEDYNVGNSFPGTYPLTIKDSRGCIYNHSIVVPNCSSCVVPTGVGASVTQNDANSVNINISATGGDTYRYCNNSTFTCNSNNCNPGDGSITSGFASFNYPLTAGQTTQLTIRVYKDSTLDCTCFKEITIPVANTTPVCDNISLLNESGSTQVISYTNCSNQAATISLNDMQSGTICKLNSSVLTLPSGVSETILGAC